MSKLELTAKGLAKLVAGNYDGADIKLNSIQIDSRKINSGDVFLALVGEEHNGHDFIEHALKQGAVLVIISQPISCSILSIYVKDTLLALGRVGYYYRSLFVGPVIGITGSCGKTTVKEISATLLGGKDQVCASAGNFNNEIGVPLTLMNLSNYYKYAVVEMAARNLGDIEYLREITIPSVVAVLNARPAHLSEFGSLENIATTKGEILSNLSVNGVAVLPYDDMFFSQWQKQVLGKKKITFGFNIKADVSAQNIKFNKQGYPTFELNVFKESVVVTSPLLGSHNIINLLAAVALGTAVDVDLLELTARIPKILPARNRFVIKSGQHGVKIIDDSYNANPSAVKVALDTLKQLPYKHKVFVFADMAELGADTVSHHKEIGRYALLSGVNKMYCYGEQVVHSVHAFGKNAKLFATHQLLIEKLQDECNQDTVMLIKGSRCNKLDKVVEQLEQ